MAIGEETMIRVLLQEQIPLLAFIRAIVRDQGMADDVFQEISVEAVRRRTHIESVEHFSAWLRRTARHRALNLLRNRRGGAVLLDPQVLDKIEAEWEDSSYSARQNVLAALQCCLDQLTPFAKRLIGLRYREGMSGRQMAQHTQRSEPSVYMALSRIRRALGDCIREKVTVQGGAE